MACTSNPSSIDDNASRDSCLGEYGGPAFPFVALGGAPKNFENAQCSEMIIKWPTFSRWLKV